MQGVRGRPLNIGQYAKLVSEKNEAWCLCMDVEGGIRGQTWRQKETLHKVYNARLHVRVRTFSTRQLSSQKDFDSGILASGT